MMLNFKHYEYESWFAEAQNDDATPTRSLGIYCRKLPSILAFGVHNGKPQFHLNFTPEEKRARHT